MLKNLCGGEGPQAWSSRVDSSGARWTLQESRCIETAPSLVWSCANVRYSESSQKNGDPNEKGLSNRRVVGKGKAVVPENELGPDLDIKATQVLDIFPSHSLSYIHLLLVYPPYAGSAEKVIEALLELLKRASWFQLVNMGPNRGAPPDASPEDEGTPLTMILDLSGLRTGMKTYALQFILSSFI